MTRMFVILTLALPACGISAETKVTMESLPAPVRTAAREQLSGATLVGVSRETEKGKTLYEVETARGGRSRDVTLDAAGAVVEVEEEIDMAEVPDAAAQALRTKSAGGKIVKVERISKKAGAALQVVGFEAAFEKNGRKREAAVTPDGKPYKD